MCDISSLRVKRTRDAAYDATLAELWAERWGLALIGQEGKTNTLYTKIIKYLSSNTPCFIVCEATCFGPYMTIIRPVCGSS